METLINTLTESLKFQYGMTVKAVNEYVANPGSKTLEFACRTQQKMYNDTLENAVKALVEAGMNNTDAFETVVKINEKIEH